MFDRTRFVHFCAVFNNIFFSRPEAASDVISGTFLGPIVCDKCAQFRSREIPPEAVVGGIFESFVHYNLRPEVDNDVVSGMAVDNFSLDVRIKFGDSRSNGFRDIRLGD